MIESKKEFQKKCKAEKAPCYLYSLTGAIIALVGLAIVLGILLLDSVTDIFLFPMQVVGYWIGAAIAVVGGALSIVGEVKLQQAFKAQLQTRE